MSSGTERRSADFSPTPVDVAALRAQGDFPRAMREFAAGFVALYEGTRLLNVLMDDRARVAFTWIALHLHFTRVSSDAGSGLTPTRMKILSTELGLCSPGRAGAMLSLMRFGGYLATDTEVGDRRQRRLIATERLISLLERRVRLHFTAFGPLVPDGKHMLAALEDARFLPAFTATVFQRYQDGFRFLTHAPGLDLFGDRSAGILILAALTAAGAPDDTVPPSRPVPVSVAGLARRFGVSRPHVLKLLRDAEARGLIARPAADKQAVLIQPELAEAARAFFATMFLYFADCAREAMRTMSAAAEHVA